MSRAGYYAETLAGTRLQRCYDVAPPRVRQALDAEIGFVLSLVRTDSTILELGCGYGRVLRPLARRVRRAIGIDTSLISLCMAREFLSDCPNCRVAAMNAALLALPEREVDVVVCVQNGLSAFHLEPEAVMREACRVVRPGGMAVFSSYSDRFWPHRLEWFRIQSEAGLIGQLDDEATADGVIVCRDGFRATTLRIADFRALTDDLGVMSEIVEVDDSTVFCVIHVGRDECPISRTGMPET
jgi:SAM-dependent methyltransferase